MKSALGLLETKGLIGAIEAADAMAKAADIKIVCKEKSTAALVTIKIVGDTAAVRSALDAGTEAAKKIGQFVAVHIIPHPDSQIDYLIKNTKKIVARPLDESEIEEVDHEEKEIIQPEVIQAVPRKEISEIPVKAEEEFSLFESHHISESEAEEFGESNQEEDSDNIEDSEYTFQADPEDIAEDEVPEDEISRDTEYSIRVPIDETEEPEDEEEIEITTEIPPIEELEELSVPELRRLARSVADFPIKGREISKANKNVLLDYFRSIS